MYCTVPHRNVCDILYCASSERWWYYVLCLIGTLVISCTMPHRNIVDMLYCASSERFMRSCAVAHRNVGDILMISFYIADWCCIAGGVRDKERGDTYDYFLHFRLVLYSRRCARQRKGSGEYLWLFSTLPIDAVYSRRCVIQRKRGYLWLEYRERNIAVTIFIDYLLQTCDILC